MIDRTKKFRPAPGGVSVGHKDITAGTLGCWVKKDGLWMILSNNHVLANCNKAKKGDPILQPGPHDGGTAADELGKLYDFVPISMTEESGCPISQAFVVIANALACLFGRRTRLFAYVDGEQNKVDCAIAKPNRDEDVLAAILLDEDTLAPLTDIAEPKVGMKVKKAGRTTGLTSGTISQTDATVKVDMDEGKIALFVDQLIVEGKVSEGGDSGSVVLTEDSKVVGLLFAGSEQVTIMNRFSNVIEGLGIGLV